MAEFVKSLREEIAKVTRKELKAVAGPLKSDIVKLKKTVAELRRQLTELNRENKKVRREAARNREICQQVEEAQVEENIDKIRVTGTMIFKLRKRLKLSQAELAALLGVTGQSVYQWERKGDESLRRMRAECKKELVKVRKLNIKEARELLEQLPQ